LRVLRRSHDDDQLDGDQLDGDQLEPLPVWVDGIECAPVSADAPLIVPRPSRTSRPSGREVAGAVASTLGDAPCVRAMTPWSSTPPLPPVTPTHFIAAFSRMIALHPEQLASLPEWWHANHCKTGIAVIARRLAIEEPRRDAGGTWRMRGRLRSPWRARTIPVELLLWPRLDAWTRMSLEPRRGVHVGRLYFSSGHRVLDVLSERLIRELRMPARRRTA
jgi:hypothetical protein